MISKRPNFFIVGAPKCGTTALFEYLSSHPDVYVPKRKEFNYFCDDLTFTNTDAGFICKNDQEYLTYFSLAASETRIGEASTWYMYSRAAAKNIHKFSPDAKIIVIIRNPIEMVYSLYYQLIENGDEYINNFEGALEVEFDRKRGLKLPKNDRLHGPIEAFYYSEVANYFNQIDRYYKLFGKKSVKVIVYDDFMSNNLKIYYEVLDFLDLKRLSPPSLETVNPNRIIRNERLWRFVKSGPPILRKTWRRTMPIQARRKILAWIISKNTVVSSRPAMKLETRAKLQRHFKTEVEQLGKLINRDLMPWVETEDGRLISDLKA